MNIEQLVSDIRVTFPNVFTQRREDCISKEPTWMIGGEDRAQMPDGLPIFTDMADECGCHDGGVHTGFTAWLSFRGFYLENHDGFWHVPTPIPTPEQVAEWKRQDAEARARYLATNPQVSVESDDGLPF